MTASQELLRYRTVEEGFRAAATGAKLDECPFEPTDARASWWRTGWQRFRTSHDTTTLLAKALTVLDEATRSPRHARDCPAATCGDRVCRCWVDEADELLRAMRRHR